MSALTKFKKFTGKHILVNESHSHVYVPKADEVEDFLMDVVESTHPEEQLEEGFELAAVMGAFEGGEMVQPEGFIAIHEADDRAYVCDEGSITFYDKPASALTLELDERDDH